ncbi:MAG TPA: GGDEF domain-containing protein [Methylophilaceae bacterium]|nr:GGDEF domain-containing protein [Methylophilaceae bacterium]HAJ73080.1 GGDEF domain-containing protein [Methylophilaceae bacterium]
MPHGHCYLWTPSLLWLYVTSDSLIAFSYFSIPVALIYFVRKRIDLEFNWIFKMFSLFIFACGITHLISIVTIWEPVYWLDASMKGITSIASVITAVMLWRLMPLALTVTSAKQLQKTIEKLQYEVAQRKEAEEKLETLNNSLEEIIQQRTFELSNINNDLLKEIDQRKLAEQELYKEKQQALVTLESIGDGVITTDMNSKITYLNPIAEKMTGWQLAEAKGRPILEIFRILNETTRKLAPNPVDVVLAHGAVCGIANHTIVVSKTGHEFAIEDSAAPIINVDGNTIGVVLVFHNVSNAKRMAEKMSYLAEHDFLTDLPNRLLLTDRVTQALSSAKRKNSRIAILYLDIDHFKKINDTLGHEVGDQLLKMLSRKLQTCIRDMDTISRQGGDEFVILLSEFDSPVAPAEIAQKLLKEANSTFQVGLHELNISASIGISMYPEDGDNADVLMRNADAAMYYAKGLGRNNYQFFTKELSTRIAEQVELENRLLKAVNQKEFRLLYQPKISLQSGRIVGAEALIRWLHPENGLVSPEIFIPIAEDMGLIKLIGRWVLREACNQNKTWQAAGVAAIPIAINVSTVELRRANYLQQVSKILMQSGLEPQFLELEVTETVAIDGDVDGIRDLLSLKEMGVKLTIDDFGTGYSSLSYLKRLPINTIKIDKSFVRDIKIDANDAAIVNAIIKMSHSLNFKVIAEGVETFEQLQFLKESECDEIQGFYFSQPLSADDFFNLLKAEKIYDV